MSDRISVDRLAEAVNARLTEYRELSTDAMKKAVKAAGNTVRSEIRKTAPVKTGRYAKSWVYRTTAENSTGIQVTVYSPNRYMLAHLLEHGHALRNGGRTRAFPHIAPAEEKGEEQLMTDIEHALKGG